MSGDRLFLVIPDTVLVALLLEAFCARAQAQGQMGTAYEFFKAAHRVRLAFNE